MQTTDTQNSGRDLRAIAIAIETYRADLGMSKAALLRSYPELGTDKTYNKIVNGDMTELDVEGRWLPAYQSAWSQIQGAETDGGDDALIEDLTGPVEVCRSYLETRHEKSNARFIVLLGDSGLGKTSAVEVMRSKPYGANIVVIEALDVWKQRGKGPAGPLLRSLGKALGIGKLPAARDELFDEVAAKLKSQRRCLVIEEGHHLCPGGLNTIKAIINTTPSLVILTAMPILWDRLTSSREAWAECKQLTGNRLAERIVLTLRESDVAAIVARRLGREADDAMIKKIAPALCAEARVLGNLKFVNKVALRFKREVKQGEAETTETFFNALKIEKKRRAA